MADVNVEFGATDVGLEKALQQIQTEMGNLQGKVKSGELSMEELESTMKRIGQVENMEKRLKAMGDASADSSPKIKKLGDEIDTAGSSAQSVGGIFDAEFKNIAAAFTVGNLAAQGFQKIIDLAFSAAQAVVQGFTDALDLGGRLNELSSRTGETAGKLLVLETAFKNSGLEAAQVGTAINKLQNFMQDAANGGDKQRAAMQNLGISMADLAGKTPTEQMQIFADKIAGIEDPTERAATASEVFGDKLGGKLLPLFSDFSGNLEDARAKVGSLEEVMDENAATFDAAAETIDAVKGKMAAFAAGVLGETIPALEDLGKSMEQVDAAGLGQDVGEFLSPRLEKLGYVVLGVVEDFKEFVSILQKLTGEGTALGKFIDHIIEFNTAMQNTINFVSPMDDLFNAFEQKGRAAADAQKELSSKTDTAAESLKSSGTAAQDATGKLDSLGTSAQATAQNIDGVFSLGSDFAPKLDGISGSWGGLNEQILGSKVSLGENLSLADSMTGSVQEQVQALGGVQESMAAIVASEKQSEQIKKTSKDLASLIEYTYGKHAEKAAEIAAKQNEIAAKEAERKETLLDAVELDIAIMQAKADGNEELAKSLENQKEIKKLTEDYKKNLGLNADEAARLANNFVAAKNAANSIANRDVFVKVTTKVNRQEYDDLMASINAGVKDKKTIEILTKITGVDANSDWNKAYQTLQNMQAINKNFDVALKISGADSLEELWQNLNAIPTTQQIQLGMQITGKDTYDEVIRSLPSFAGTKEAKLLLKQEGFENMTQFINTLKGVPDEKRTNLIVEALGVPDVNAAKAALDRVLINDGKKSTVSVGADTAEAEQKLKSVRQSTSIPLAFQTKAEITSAMSEIDKVKKSSLTPLTLSLKGDASDVAKKVAAFDGNPIKFFLNGNSAPITNTIDALSSAPLSLSLHGDTTAVQSQIQSITGSPKNIDLNADQSIQKIQGDLKKEVDVSLQSSEGTKILNSMNGFVSDIKSLVETLSNKLPVPVLA